MRSSWRFFLTGDFCGEMALLDGLPRSADAVAAEETHLYGLNRKDFIAYVMNNEAAVKAILSALSKRLRKADDFLEDVFFLNVAARLAKKLIELAGSNGFREEDGGPIKLSVTQKDLAGMIGATRESVNKELRSLREKNLIALFGKHHLDSEYGWLAKENQVAFTCGKRKNDAIRNRHERPFGPRSGAPGAAPRDNVVWQVDRLDDYRHFAEPFARQAIRDNRRTIYFRFAPHAPILPPIDGLETIAVNPHAGFDAFSGILHQIIEAEGREVFYIFDSLSALVVEWATDELLANFFQVTCPFLFELDTVAYFALTRGRHSHSAVARIRDTTQLLLDVYQVKERGTSSRSRSGTATPPDVPSPCDVGSGLDAGLRERGGRGPVGIGRSEAPSVPGAVDRPLGERLPAADAVPRGGERTGTRRRRRSPPSSRNSPG